MTQLRRELDKLTNIPDIAYELVDEQVQKVEQLKLLYPHDIELHELASKTASHHNCYMYALGITFNDILTWYQSGGTPNSIFVRGLIENGTLEPIGDPSAVTDGAILIYFGDSEIPVHAGIKSDNKVISKWGCGYTHTWRHQELEVPASYGNSVRVFRHPDQEPV